MNTVCVFPLTWRGAVLPPVARTPVLSPVLVSRYGPDGFGVVSGDTAIDGDPTDPDVPDTPVVALVRLYRDQDGALMRKMMSAPNTGAWSFSGLSLDYTYTALAYYAGFRAVVADGVRPVLP